MVAIASSDDVVDLRNKDREAKFPVSKRWVKGLINRRYQKVYREKETLSNLRSLLGTVVWSMVAASTLRRFDNPSAGSGQAGHGSGQGRANDDGGS